MYRTSEHIYAAIGYNLYRHRARSCKNQKEFAAKIGLSTNDYSRIENGTTCSIVSLCKIANCIHMKADKLISYDNKLSPIVPTNYETDEVLIKHYIAKKLKYYINISDIFITDICNKSNIPVSTFFYIKEAKVLTSVYNLFKIVEALNKIDKDRVFAIDDFLLGG